MIAWHWFRSTNREPCSYSSFFVHSQTFATYALPLKYDVRCGRRKRPLLRHECIYTGKSRATEISEDLPRQLKISVDKYIRRVMRLLRIKARPFFYMEHTTSVALTSEVTDKVISILVSS